MRDPRELHPTHRVKETLLALIGAHARIRDVHLDTDPVTGAVRSIYTEFASREDVARARQAVPCMPVRPRLRPLFPERSIAFVCAPGAVRIHLGDDAPAVPFTCASIESAASRFGTVERIAVESEQVIHIILARREEAEALMDDLGRPRPHTNVRIRWSADVPPMVLQPPLPPGIGAYELARAHALLHRYMRNVSARAREDR